MPRAYDGSMVQTQQRRPSHGPPVTRSDVMALVQHFQMYDRVQRALEKLSPIQREAALHRGLQTGADARSVVLAALILNSEQRLLDEPKIA